MSTAREREARRRRIRRAVAAQGGLATTSQLVEQGIGYPVLAAERAAGRWHEVAPGVVRIGRTDETALLWRAVLAAAPRSGLEEHPRAALGGLTALQLCGLQGVDGDGMLHVAAPKSSRPLKHVAGVRIHETRRWRDEDIAATGLPHVRPAMALVQAAFWARTDREAALMVLAPLQQRVTTVADVATALELVRRARRRSLVAGMLLEFAGGVQSLNELDFARRCRVEGLPEPDRQAVLRRPGGSYYLDVRWSRWRVTVEIDGVGHLEVTRWLADNLRHNEIATAGDIVLRVPSVGLRLDPAPYLDSVRRALKTNGCPL